MNLLCYDDVLTFLDDARPLLDALDVEFRCETHLVADLAGHVRWDRRLVFGDAQVFGYLVANSEALVLPVADRR